MIHLSNSNFLRAGLISVLIAVTPIFVMAGPGAHGPNGEHLDAPQAGQMGARQASPRIESKSDLFELVGTLAGGELSILIDRFETNEPLLKAQVEVESGGMKAQAKFHEDIGDYSVDDPAMLKKLSTPGEHPLVITVIAGQDSDLLDAVLRVDAHSLDNAHGIHWEWWGLGVIGALTLLGIAAAHLRKKHHRSFSQGEKA